MRPDAEAPRQGGEPAAETSKTRRKLEMKALQKFGERLVNLGAVQLEHLGLPKELHSAILDARRIRQHGARQRQLRYIGRLMRSIDILPVREALEKLDDEHRSETRAHHEAEQWRDRLITGRDDSGLNTLAGRYPGLDRQHVRQLVRNARKQRELNLPPRAGRLLYHYLIDILRGE